MPAIGNIGGTKTLVQYIADRGIDSILVCPPNFGIDAAARSAGVRVQNLFSAGDLDLPFAYRLTQFLQEARPDLVHCHSRRGADMLGGLAASYADIPAVVSRRVDNAEMRLVATLRYRPFAKIIAISETIARVLHEHGIDWWEQQLTEYQALPPWKDFPAIWERAARVEGTHGETYPFWLLTARSMQYAWGGNAGVQMIKEVADNVSGHSGVIINRGAADALGIADGDWVEVRSPLRATRGRAVLREGIRPDTLLMIGHRPAEEQLFYPESELARGFGAEAPEPTSDPKVAYSDVPPTKSCAPPEWPS